MYLNIICPAESNLIFSISDFNQLVMGLSEESVTEAAANETILLEDLEEFEIEEDWDLDPVVYPEFYCPLEHLRGGPFIP